MGGGLKAVDVLKFNESFNNILYKSPFFVPS